MEASVNSPRKTAIEFIESAGKCIIGFAALCYVIGLVVVSCHLNRYGVNYIGLLRINYVIAGVWTLLPVLLVLFVSFMTFCILIGVLPAFARFVSRFTGRSAEEFKNTNRFGVPVFFLVPFSILSLFYIYVTFFMIVGASPFEIFAESAKTAFMSTLTIVTGPAVMLFASKVKRYHTSKAGLRNAFILVILTVHLSVYAVTFSYEVYGKIPAYIGGGKLKTVRFLLEIKPTAKTYLEAEGIEFKVKQEASIENRNRDNKEIKKDGKPESGIYITGDVYLVFYTDNDYFIVVPNKSSDKNYNVVTLKKDIVKALVHEFPRGGGY